MQQTVASVFRRFAFAAFLGLWLLASGSVVAAAPAVPPTKKVQDIAAWDPYGLGGSTLSNVVLANNSFSGKLHVENIPDELLPDVIGFKSDGQRLYNLALIYPGKALVSLVPALRGTAVADAELPQLVVLLAPAANAGASIQLPVQVGTVKMPFDAGTTMRLDAGANILARANFGGQTAALLNMVGAPSRDLTLSGKIDPRMLSGAGLKNAPQNELINAIDLRVALRAPSLQRKPAYLVFGDSALVMKGISGKIASGIATSLSVNVGSGVRFDSVTINRDPVKRLVSIASSSINPGAKFLSLPIDGAAITDVVLNGLIDEQAPANDRYTLDGHYAVGGSTPREFTAALSGGTPAQYAVTVQTDTTLGQLMGWPVPGVDALVLKDVAFGNDYILGNLTLKGLKFTVALFKGHGQTKFNAALLSDSTFGLPKLMNSLTATPLADLELTHPGFVLVPPENAGKAIGLPKPVADHLKMQTADLEHGLNLITHGNTSGEVAALLKGVGLSQSNLLINGTLDPALLADRDGPLTPAFIDAARLQVTLPPAAPQGKPPYLTFGNSVLAFKGMSGKIAASIATSLKVNVGSGVSFDSVTISRDPVKRLVSIASSGINPGAKFLSLPIDGARITDVLFNGLIDEQVRANDRYTLDGHYAVGGSTPREFTAALSGGTPAQYAVTVQTDTTLGRLMGWSAPGLDTVAFKEIVFGNGYSLGNISAKGMAFTVVVFKGAGQAKSNAAFLSDETFGLPKLMTALKDTPLADLELVRPGFVLVPPENAGNAVKLPDAVTRHVGAPSVDLKQGLNLIANGNTYGDLAALLDKLGIAAKGLPIVGTLDPSILSNADAAALAQRFLDALDLRIPFQKISLPDFAHNVTASNGYLALKGLTKGIDASVATRLTVSVGAARPVFDTSLRLVKAASGNTVSVSGDYPGAWNRPLDISWLNIRNVKIAGSLGPTGTLAVAGTTDIGSVKNLTVSLDLATKSDGGTDVVLQVSGADVSLADIPALSSIPNIGDLKFRDLLVSARAIGGTLSSAKLALLHGVQAIAFESGGFWNLAAMLGDMDLSRLMALPRFAQSVLGKVKLGNAALLLSQRGLSGRVADLPRAAQAKFLAIYGSPNGAMQASSGVSLVSQFDPASMGPGVTAFLPPGQKLVLQGSAGGVVGGGTPSLALSATIPSVTLPSTLAFLKLPSSARTAFFINLSQTSASAGVEIDAVIAATLNKQTIDFQTTVALGLDKQGGVAVDLQGKSLNAWRNAMGISGFSLDPGTRIEIKTAATSELTLTFVGKTHIGSREADAAGSASILGGVVDKGAFEVKLSELTLSDVLALFNEAVKAGGGQPVKADFPDAKLTNVDIALASPGANVPELNLPNGGTRLAGDLWFLMKGKPLTRVKSQMSESSFVMSGDISDFTLGPVAMKGNSLDIRAQTSPPLPPQFKIRGGATIMNKHVSGEIDSGLAETAIVTSIDLGGLLNLDVHASFDTPAAGMDPGALASQDMALNGRLKSDIGAWLRGAGKKAVSTVFDSVGGDIKKLVADVESAKKTADSLNGQIRKARERALAGLKTVDQQIVQAQKKVDDLASRVNSLNGDIKSEKGKIQGCNYSISICYWWNWRGHCTKHKDVPDPARDAECEVNNGRHAATVAADEAALKTVQAAKLAADGVLTGLKKGEKGVDIASLDPEVIALEAALAAADLALNAAKTLAQGAELGVGQLEAGLKALDRLDTFKLTGSTISGSFQKAVAGKPVVLGLDFEAAGKPLHLRLALSLTDPAYNAKQFDTLALLVAKEAVEALPNAAPVVTRLLNNAFKTQHDAADKEVEQAAKSNGLE